MKTQIKAESKYKFVKNVIIPIDTDSAGRRHPQMSALDNIIAETIQDAKYFRVEGIKIDNGYNVRIYGSRNKE